MRWHWGRRFTTLFLVALVLPAVLAPISDAGQPRAGGTMRFALEGEPPTLDPQWTTATVVMTVGSHWLESLFTQGAKYEIIPDLAEGYTLSNDLRVYEISLRKGVLFHNGKEMTSDDVVASLNRWGQVATDGKNLFRNVDKVEAADKYRVRITLQKGSAVVPAFLTWTGRAFIYPKEVVDEAGTKGPVKTYIGTGPFQFVEHRPDRHIRLKRFDKYVARSDRPNGFGGKKVAYFDEILMIPVPEQAQRVTMVQTGELDFSDWISPDAFDRLKADPQITTLVVKPKEWIIGVLNKKKGLFTSKTMRQAVQAALSMKPIMTNAVGRPEFYRLDPSIMFQESVWWTDVGKDLYDQGNAEKAKRLMREAGYKGETIRWICTKEYEWMYQSAVIGAQQLKEAGFNVDLQVMDWASVVQRRTNPDAYEIFTTGQGMPADPAQFISLTCGWPGWACFPELDELMLKVASTAKVDDRARIWKQVQAYFYENAVNIKMGDFFTLRIHKNYVKGYTNMNLAFLWNTWFEK
ncbi:MAG TPA: ABC transporter substrate-binding protein [Candidatus Methylomirabilis sp.]|nr:ABC transporter substrate-binding protein [Candidatus Methylomirabilis sp.]